MREAAELADRVADAVEQLGVLAHEELGAERAAGLLVGHQAEDHVARRLLAARERAHERGEHHRDAALHVERAAPPDVAVGDLAGERRMRPVAARGDDVDVALQQQRRTGAATAQARDQVRPRRLGREDARLAAELLEQVADPLDARALVARRVARVEAQQRCSSSTGRSCSARSSIGTVSPIAGRVSSRRARSARRARAAASRGWRTPRRSATASARRQRRREAPGTAHAAVVEQALAGRAERAVRAQRRAEPEAAAQHDAVAARAGRRGTSACGASAGDRRRRIRRRSWRRRGRRARRSAMPISLGALERDARVHDAERRRPRPGDAPPPSGPSRRGSAGSSQRSSRRCAVGCQMR